MLSYVLVQTTGFGNYNEEKPTTEERASESY